LRYDGSVSIAVAWRLTNCRCLPGQFVPHGHESSPEENMIGRIGSGRTSCLASWMFAIMLAVPVASAPTWKLQLAIHYLPPATNHSQYDVVLAWPGQVLFLGGSDIGGHGKPKAERLMNGIPQSLPLPIGAHSWITAASAPSRTDIWAVTILGGSVLKWNGSAWKTAPRGNWKTGTRFTGITALSSTNVWVFGTSGRRYPGAGTWHFDGTSWTRVNGVAGGIFQASAAARTDIWGIGNAGRTGNALLHFGGSAWQRVRPTALAGFTYTHVLALSRANVWVEGSVAGVPKLGHFNGHGWTELRMPGRTAATGMCRDGRAGMWVIANSGAAPSIVLDRSRTGTWTTSVVSQNTANEILACALVPRTTRAWGAGKASAPQGSAAAAYRAG
jgi:hypothetical protein